MNVTDSDRSASTDAIRAALERATWPPCIGLDQHDTFAAKEIAETVVAAVRAMSPAEQAELAGLLREAVDADGVEWERFVTDWREVTE